jgi:hypothetical protein
MDGSSQRAIGVEMWKPGWSRRRPEREMSLRKREESRNTWKRWRSVGRQTIGYCLDDAIGSVSQVAQPHGDMPSTCPKNVEMVLVDGVAMREDSIDRASNVCSNKLLRRGRRAEVRREVSRRRASCRGGVEMASSKLSLSHQINARRWQLYARRYRCIVGCGGDGDEAWPGPRKGGCC